MAELHILWFQKALSWLKEIKCFINLTIFKPPPFKIAVNFSPCKSYQINTCPIELTFYHNSVAWISWVISKLF